MSQKRKVFYTHRLTYFAYCISDFYCEIIITYYDTHTTRTHVIAPKDLIEEVDKLVGPRRRSKFISEAVAEKVERENRIRAVRHAMTLPALHEPGWETPEAVSKWVRDIRADSDPKEQSQEI